METSFTVQLHFIVTQSISTDISLNVAVYVKNVSPLMLISVQNVLRINLFQVANVYLVLIQNALTVHPILSSVPFVMLDI